MNYDVFISYRRSSGQLVAEKLYYALQSKGYRCFFDFNSLRDGLFNNQIYDAIKSAENFILVLSEGTLDNCLYNSNDWVRLEIEFAMKHNKNIIPLCLGVNRVSLPSNLPFSMRSLYNIQISELGERSLYEPSIDILIRNRFKKKAYSKDPNHNVWPYRLLLLIIVPLFMGGVVLDIGLYGNFFTPIVEDRFVDHELEYIPILIVSIIFSILLYGFYRWIRKYDLFRKAFS